MLWLETTIMLIAFLKASYNASNPNICFGDRLSDLCAIRDKSITVPIDFRNVS